MRALGQARVPAMMERLQSIKDIRERLEAHSIPEPNSGCWIWLGRMEPDGYCRTYYEGRYENVHRVSWKVFRGKIPEGKFILHSCDVRCCMNPDHLFVGTQQDNMDDMIRKGRHVVGNLPSGEDHNWTKLTEKDAIYILTSNKKGVDLALELGVTRSCISHVRVGNSWKHLQR